MKVRSIAATAALALVAVCMNVPANAGPNDFFGSTVGGNADAQQGAGVAANTQTSPPAGDYTGDEKRIQKKFKANLKSAQALVAKGDKMAKSTDATLSKKGKILKEIGEKRLAELKSNNPFPEIAAKEFKRPQ